MPSTPYAVELGTSKKCLFAVQNYVVLIAFSTLFILAILLIFVLLRPQFGKRPKGKHLDKISQSRHYRQGSFQNLEHTPSLTDGATTVSVLRDFLFKKVMAARPKSTIPSCKTELFTALPNEDFLVWMGHSSYYIQVDGRRILVDPVLGGSASPIPGGTKAFKGTDPYSVADIPELDLLLLSHDHWDHLDYKTIKAIRPKVKQVITGLGTGAHLNYWGYPEEIVREKDWNESLDLGAGWELHTTPARHFSGRGLKRNQTLWLSFVLKTPSWTLFLGGDSGLGAHLSDIGKRFGPFDLAILENGQYDRRWRHIHLLPEEIMSAARMLKAKKILPVHSSKFMLAAHPWKEPLEKIAMEKQQNNPEILTPMIGEKMLLSARATDFRNWWESVE